MPQGNCAAFQQRRQQILFARYKYLKSATRFIHVLISQNGKREAGAQPGV